MSQIADIFEQLIRPEDGDFSAELAQYVLGLAFTSEQVERYHDLAARNGEGPLSDKDRAELDAFVQANTILTIMQSKARRSLVQNTSAA